MCLNISALLRYSAPGGLPTAGQLLPLFFADTCFVDHLLRHPSLTLSTHWSSIFAERVDSPLVNAENLVNLLR
jgi:hypothetical protein